MKILAFDLGTSCGWATNRYGAWIYGTLDLRPGRYSGGGMRYVIFGNELEKLFGDSMELVVFEEVRHHTAVDAAHVYGGLLAVLTARCERFKVPYQGVPVGTIKKHATGKGNASKELMIEAAIRLCPLLGIKITDITDDEADAICLLHYAVKTFGKPFRIPPTDDELALEDKADLEQRTRAEEKAFGKLV